METINNAASAAAKAVWGEGNNKEEPVSGQTGDVSKGEPYDSGNADAPGNTGGSGAASSATQGSSNTGGNISGSGGASSANDGSTTTGGNTGGSGGPPAARSGLLNTEGNSSGSGVASSAPQDSSSGTSGSDPQASATKDSSHAPGDSTASQGDVRHPSDPSTNPDKADKRQNVDDSTGGMDKDDNPQKVDGPGPAPIEDVAKAHGGDAGKAKSNESVNKAGKDGGADDEEDGDGPQKTSHGEGTGEKYIKSSGLQADGGDFDAAKAGAGREADRLLEEKGIHHDGDNHGKPQQSDDAPSAGGIGEKRKLGDTLKAHLHSNKQQH